MMHNRRGHGSTFDLLFKQRGRSLLFSELQSTPCLENKWGFVLRLAPSVLSCKPSTALEGARGAVCATLIGGALLRAVWFRTPPNQQLRFLAVPAALSRLCGSIRNEAVFQASDLQKYPDTHTGPQIFEKGLPASPGQPRVQLILHA